MSDRVIDGNLVDWNCFKNNDWNSLLLGNGFSINIWERFNYETLYKLSKNSSIGYPLSDECQALFSRIDDTNFNFENVLRILYYSLIVDEQLGEPRQKQIQALYESIKKALTSAINYVHVPPNKPNFKELNNQFTSYKNVFSTNYDLIPYWAIMYDTNRFKDFFWGSGNTFDISNVSVQFNCTKIFFLHGAIHLFEFPTDKTAKQVANEDNCLTELFDLSHPERLPLLVTEGSSSRKLSRIKKNDYLRFCYEELTKIQDGLVVLGHSLNKDYDQHIIDALNQSDVKKLAIGVWPELDADFIISFKARLHSDLPNKKLHFYNSQTHPLGKIELNVPIV